MTEPKKKMILPLSKPELVFCEKYAHCQDLGQAAAEAGMAPERGPELWQKPKIRAEVKRLRNLVTREQAKLKARKNIVQIHKVDKELMKVVEADIKEAPGLATPKLNACELAYRRVGILIDDNFVPDQPTGAQPANDGPRVYRALETTLITHEVVTTQQVTQRSVVASGPPPAPLPAPQRPPLIIDQSLPSEKDTSYGY